MRVGLFVAMVLAIVVVRAQDDDDDEVKVKRKIYDDPDKYKNLVDWLKDGKAEFSKVEIEVRSDLYRALRAKQNINVQVGEICSVVNGSSLFPELTS